MRTLTSLATLFTLALGVTACGDDKEMTTNTPTSDPPTTMTDSSGSDSATVEPPTTMTDPTTMPEPTTTETGPEPTGSTTEVDPTQTDPSGSTTEVVDPSATDTTATDTTATGGGDESPYQACASDTDCDMGAICINAMVTGDQIKGSFCSPACSGPGNLCPDPAPGVQTSQAAQCIFGPAMMPPTNCAIICSVGEDECGPESDCEDIGQAPMMGVTLGVCSTPP